MFGLFKSKPFYKNKTKDDFIKWFSKEKYWKQLNKDIINSIIDKSIDDPLAFEVFVFISESCDLVKNNYVRLSKDSSKDINFILPTFALTLYNTGALYRDQFLKSINEGQDPKSLSKIYEFALFGFESAIKIDEYCFGAYYQLAFLRGFLNKAEGARNYCLQGISKIDELESKNKDSLTHMEKAALNDISNSRKLFNEMIDNINND